MLDSAIRIARPRPVMAAMPALTSGMIAGERPSNGSSRSSISGSRASARAIESILRSPPLISGPDLEGHAAQDVARLDEDVDAGEAQHADARDVPGLRPTTVSITRWSARIAAGTALASTLP